MNNDITIKLNNTFKYHLLELYEYSKIVPITLQHFDNLVDEYSLCYNSRLIVSTLSCNEQHSTIERILKRAISESKFKIHCSISRRILDTELNHLWSTHE